VTIFDLDRQVVNEYERFARSFTMVRADDLRSQLQQAYATSRFWAEPTPASKRVDRSAN
jgi:hypothetical protein